MKLKLGISTCFFHPDLTRPIFKGKTLVYAEQSLTHWAMSQGALAYLIPPPKEGGPVSIADLANELDGLILEGGSDVSPKNYGETPLKPEWNGDYIRDVYETQLLKEFVKQGKPVLGVCRGAQLINVAYGGTLYQDIATQIPTARNHRDAEIYDQNFHMIQILSSSGLSKIYPEKTTAKTNTIHHQAIKDLGKGLIAEAICSEDQVIEAIRLDSPNDWVFATQWHPEFHDAKDPTLLDSAPLLTDFLNAVRCRRS